MQNIAYLTMWTLEIVAWIIYSFCFIGEGRIPVKKVKKIFHALIIIGLACSYIKVMISLHYTHQLSGALSAVIALYYGGEWIYEESHKAI